MGADPDRSWCNIHTSVKLFWSQPMPPWTLAAAYSYAVAVSMDSWAATIIDSITHLCVPSLPQIFPSFISILSFHLPMYNIQIYQINLFAMKPMLPWRFRCLPKKIIISNYFFNFHIRSFFLNYHFGIPRHIIQKNLKPEKIGL